MITLFSGIPRSGKSYLMTAEAWKGRDKYFIIHNIIGFKTELLKGFGFDWVDYITKNNIEADVFFSKDFQIELAQKIKEKYNRPMLVIIDEAHEWFDTHKKAIKMWLSYHGHLDQEIYLVAHASTNIPKVYRSFVACEYRAKSSSFLFIPGYFFYNRLLGGVRSGYRLERKNQKIFDLYQSSDIKEKKRKKSWYIPFLIFVIVGCFAFFLMSPKLIFNRGKKAESQKVLKEKELIAQKEIAHIKAVNSDEFENLYAYVGNINGQIILENKKTGVQFPLDQYPKDQHLVGFDRAKSCRIYFSNKKIVTLYNFDRYIAKTKDSTGSIMGAIEDKEQSGPLATGRPEVRTNASGESS